MYCVYKITNKLNGMYYIGVHKSANLDDNYFGSGKYIKRAIKKYGKECFYKQLLFITHIKENAYNYEKHLTRFQDNKCYNIKLGGHGGFSVNDARKGAIAVLVKYGNSISRLGAQRAIELGHGFGGKKDPVLCGRKGGVNNAGKPKSEKHKQALRQSWLNKKLVSSNGKTVSS